MNIKIPIIIRMTIVNITTTATIIIAIYITVIPLELFSLSVVSSVKGAVVIPSKPASLYLPLSIASCKKDL